MFKIKTRKTAIVSLALASAISAPAFAGNFYVSGQISASKLGHTIERNTAGTVLPVPDTGGISLTETTDLSGGIAFGYKQNFNNDKLYWAAEAFYNVEDSSSRNINGVLVTDIDLESSYGARVIGGANVTPDLSLYAHIGVTALDFDATNSYTFAPPVRNASYTETGISFGVGADYKISDSSSVFIDYTQVADVSFDGIPEVAGGTNRVNPNDLDLSKISIGYKFSF